MVFVLSVGMKFEVCALLSHPLASVTPHSFPTTHPLPDAQPELGPPPFKLEHYPTLPTSSASSLATSPTTVLSPANLQASSPRDEPAFLDPSLLNSLSIFFDKELSHLPLSLDSIHFKNVTIRKAKKNPTETPSETIGKLGFYMPISTRLKNAARQTRSSPSSSQVLRASTPEVMGSP